MYESLVIMRPRVQAVSPKVCIGALLSKRRTIENVLEVCKVVCLYELMKNGINDKRLLIHKI